VLLEIGNCESPGGITTGGCPLEARCKGKTLSARHELDVKINNKNAPIWQTMA
jgi:hypothetical protein